MAGEYQPIDYSGGNGFLQGLQGAGLYQQVQQQRAQAEQAKQQQAAQQAFQQDWQKAYSSGDPQQLDAIIAKYPGQMETVQKAIGFRDDNHRMALGNTARDLRVAMQSGNPDAIAQAAQKNASALESIGSSPQEFMQMYQQDPQGAMQTVDTVGMGALGVKDYYGVQNDQQQRQIDRDKLTETVRSNQAGEGLQARGQNITMRGQDISTQNSQRSAGGSVPSSVREYQYFNSLSPEQQKTYMRVRGRPDAGDGGNTVQLADGRTVSVAGKLHGSGANAFYEGVDDAGNMVRVPASAIAAPPTSAAVAQNYAMKKDLDVIAGAPSGDLDFMTGVTGGNGAPALGADVRSRLTGKEQRQLYNATQRIQGKMQNQGIAAARDMGASGINTVTEAKMYFQGMPQVDYSSPEAMQNSVRDIQEYTDNYNQQYNVNVGGRGKNQQSTAQPASQQPSAGGGFSNLWGG
ncbi:phage DNA ejection protein [Yersinia rochesterensis]|uniref:phage DNA ejection protein n=1 Tax=Yersinia rochesterensis TaxID=1604335 RepID=UPI00068AB46D|nr:phage DNA ejection protein [Yersinia rochesterensis]